MDEQTHTPTGLDRIRQEETVPAVIIDHDGLVTHVNDAFVTAFGWAREAILGRSITVIIPRTLRDAHHIGFARFAMTGEPTLIGRTLELPVVDFRGNELRARHRIEAELRDGAWVFGATIDPLPGCAARARAV